MQVFLVDRHIPGSSVEQLYNIQRSAIEMSDRFAATGKRVRYIRSTFVPGTAHAMCLFEADSASLVEEVNEAAELPFISVTEALDLTP